MKSSLTALALAAAIAISALFPTNDAEAFFFGVPFFGFPGYGYPGYGYGYPGYGYGYPGYGYGYPGYGHGYPGAYGPYRGYAPMGRMAPMGMNPGYSGEKDKDAAKSEGGSSAY